MKVLKYFMVLILGLLMVQDLEAQYRYGYFKVGVSAGSTHYLGDLDNDFTFQFTKPGVGISGSYRMNPFMSARLNFFRGYASASDAAAVSGVSLDTRTENLVARKRRNLSFRTPITEASVQFVFDFIATDRRYAYRPPFVPYVFAGFGLFTFNPQAQLGDRWYDLQPLGTEGQHLADPSGIYPEPYSLTQFTIPMGTGVRFSLSRRLDLELETGFRKTFTDYLDDVSNLYPDMDDLRAQNPVAALLSDRIDLNEYPEGAAFVNGIRGDRTQTDWYIYTAVRVSYILDWVKCPTFR